MWAMIGKLGAAAGAGGSHGDRDGMDLWWIRTPCISSFLPVAPGLQRDCAADCEMGRSTAETGSGEGTRHRPHPEELAWPASKRLNFALVCARLGGGGGALRMWVTPTQRRAI